MQETNRLLRLVRKLADLPDGTLIVSPEDIGSKTPRGRPRFPGIIFAVEMDTWDPSWPADVLALRSPGLPNSVHRVLGGLVHAGPDSNGRNIPAGQLIVWSLAWPNDPPICALFPPDFSPTDDQRKRLDEARGAFLELRDPRGRWRGSGEYLKTAEHLETATFEVVCGLINKSRDPAFRPTYDDIGREIDTKYRTTKTDRWANPEESFPRLCQRRGLNPRELVDRAIAACASGE
jgi:hypothetical protein